MLDIPDSFRPLAKAKAIRLLSAEPDEGRQARILNSIWEEEWKLDRLEWRSWMDTMKRKFRERYP